MCAKPTTAESEPTMESTASMQLLKSKLRDPIEAVEGSGVGPRVDSGVGGIGDNNSGDSGTVAEG